MSLAWQVWVIAEGHQCFPRLSTGRTHSFPSDWSPTGRPVSSNMCGCVSSNGQLLDDLKVSKILCFSLDWKVKNAMLLFRSAHAQVISWSCLPPNSSQVRKTNWNGVPFWQTWACPHLHQTSKFSFSHHSKMGKKNLQIQVTMGTWSVDHS